MTRLFSKSAFVLAAMLYFSVELSLQANVSPKVDFDDDQGHVPPKIQGVRVIVDATKMNGGKMDDKTETIRIQTDGAKQTVGIHTDITFEIDKKNHTKSADGKNAESVEDDDDTEVPIYRGTHTEGDRNDMNRPRDPNDYYMNRANFHGVNDEEGMRYGGAGAGTWVRFLPMANGGWTTERYSESFKPQNRRFQSSGFVPYGIGQRSFQGCICNDRSMWRDVNRRSYGSSTLKPQGTDDKLEYPFSETD